MLRYDLHNHKGKNVIVVGAGNSAMNVVFQLLNIAERVYLINSADKPNADEISLNRVKDNPRVKILNSTSVTEILGKDRVQQAKILHLKDKKSETLDVDSIFVEIGYVPSIDYLNGLVQLNERDEIIMIHIMLQVLLEYLLLEM